MEGIIERGQAYKPYKENRKVPPDECHGEIKNITPGLPDQMIVSGHDGQFEYGKNYIMQNWRTYSFLHLRGMINFYLSPESRRICTLLGIEKYGFPDGFLTTSSFKDKVVSYFRYKPVPEIAIGIYILALSGFVYFFTIIGFIKLAQQREWFIIALFLLTMLYFTFLPGPLGEGRQRVPIVPVYTAIASYGLLKAFGDRGIRFALNPSARQTSAGRP